MGGEILERWWDNRGKGGHTSACEEEETADAGLDDAVELQRWRRLGIPKSYDEEVGAEQMSGALVVDAE